MSRNRLTETLTFEGVGLHTGQPCRAVVHPAEPGSGILFVVGGREIEARPGNVAASERRTVLTKGGAQVSTVEHLLAALTANGVWDARIESEGGEVPDLDGSAALFAGAVAAALEEEGEVEPLRLTRPVSVTDGDSRADVLPAEGLELAVTVEFPGTAIGIQHCEAVITPELFNEQLAPARTFVERRAVDAVLAAGYGKGGSLENVLVAGETEYENEPRFADEPARHKALDLLGDLALLGRPLAARIVARCPGHAINHKLVNAIKEAAVGGPVVDILGILEHLPHRYPMLLVDRIIEIEESRVVALKNVTYNEPFFQGHFPAEPVMPGVLVVEALAQAGGALLFHKLRPEERRGKLVYFTAIDGVKFRRKVVPGDVLRLELELLRFGGKLVKMKGTATVEGEAACEGEFTAVIVDGPGG